MTRPTPLWFFVLLMLLPSLCLAQSAYLQPDRIFEGDITMLVVEHESRFPSLYALDTEELEKSFEILDVEAGTSRVIISGRHVNRMQWKLQIAPRGTGKLEVPAVGLADGFTPELILEVLPLSGQGRVSQNVFVQIETNPENPYVGQQTTIILRLVHNIPVFDGYWSEPVLEHAQVFRDLNDARFSRITNGARLSVVERRMALFARSPGDLTGSPASYRARIQAPATDGSKFRRVFRQSEPLRIKVRDIPDGFSGRFWLPARQLEIEQHWGESDELQVGDTLDRSLTILARGLPADALPADFLTGNSEELKLYADKEKRSDRFDDHVLVGQLEQAYAMVLTRPGKIRIPEVRLKWWDTGEDIEKEAVAEGKTVTVNPALPGQVGSGILQPTPLSGNASRAEFSLRDSLVWLPPLIVVLIALLLVYRRFGGRVQASLQTITGRHYARRLLKQACLANDPVDARMRVIHWGRQQWPEATINGLYQIKSRIFSDKLTDELSELDAALFSRPQGEWQGDRLWRLILEEPRLARSIHRETGADFFDLDYSGGYEVFGGFQSSRS